MSGNSSRTVLYRNKCCQESLESLDVVTTLKRPCQTDPKSSGQSNSQTARTIHPSKDPALTESKKPAPAKKVGTVVLSAEYKSIDRKGFKNPIDQCQYRTRCYQCKDLVHRIRSLLDEIKAIRKNVTPLAVCEVCKRYNTLGKCRRCEYLQDRYKISENIEDDARQQRFKIWLCKVKQFLYTILERETCKHKVYSKTPATDELTNLLHELKSPLTLREPVIGNFPSIDSLENITESKDILEEVLMRLKSKERSEDYMFQASCVCKYFADKKFKEQVPEKDLSGKEPVPPPTLKDTASETQINEDSETKRNTLHGDGRDVKYGKGGKNGGDRGDARGGRYSSDVGGGRHGRGEKDGIDEGYERHGRGGRYGIDGEEGRYGKGGRDGIDGGGGRHGKSGRDGKDGDDERGGGYGKHGKDGKDRKRASDGRDERFERGGRDGKNGVDERGRGYGKHGRDGKDGKRGSDGGDERHGRGGRDGKDGVDERGGGYGKDRKRGGDRGDERHGRGGKSGKDGVDERGGGYGKDGKYGRDGKDGKRGSDGGDEKHGRGGRDKKDEGGEGYGKDGKQGRDGRDGKYGKDGRDGRDGKDGKYGKDGKDGKYGKDGKDGKDGQDGKNDIDGIYAQVGLEKKSESPKGTKDAKEKSTKKTDQDTIKFPKMEIPKESKPTKPEKLPDMPKIEDLPIPTIKVKSVESGSGSYIECDVNEREPTEMIKGSKIVPIEPRISLATGSVQPMFFKAFPECADHNIVSSTATPTSRADKMKKDHDKGSSKGVIRYMLSDREFIDKGWTLLPTTKIMRRMNIYKMKPANPKMDWFLRHKDQITYYDSGEKLAEIEKDGSGKLFYKNGNVALVYYCATEANVGFRYVIYSSGENTDAGKKLPITVLASFDFQGNGVVYDHYGNERLKYNQSEGIVIDDKIGPPGRWKWHALNEPPVLQPVFADVHMRPNQCLQKLFRSRKDDDKSDYAGKQKREPNLDMLAIELENFLKEKAQALLQEFKPFQIRMKALKVNDQFSLKVIDQASVYLLFRDGKSSIKFDLGMLLISNEIVDTDTAEVTQVATPYDRHPAKSDSIVNIQVALEKARKLGKARGKLRH